MEWMNDNSGAVMVVFTFVLAVATIVLAYSTTALWLSSRQSNKITSAINRAYVTMSHHTPSVDHQTNEFVLPIEVRNKGDTPALVTDIHLEYSCRDQNDPYPEPIKYNLPIIQKPFLGFLASNDFVNRTYRLPNDIFTSDIMSGSKKLLFYGYVQYQDQFGVNHRAGYGRVYNPNNKSLDVITEARFNYDDPIEQNFVGGKYVGQFLDFALVLSTIVAAFLWFYASLIETPDNIDMFVSALQRISFWNACAAFASGIAAVSLLLRLFWPKK